MYKPEIEINVTVKAKDYDILKQEILEDNGLEIYLGIYYFRIFNKDIFKIMAFKKDPYYELKNLTKEAKSIRGSYRTFGVVKKLLLSEFKKVRKNIKNNLLSIEDAN